MPGISLKYRITVGLSEGLHARPSALLSELLVSFSSSAAAVVTVANSREASASAESTLELMMLGVKSGETITISTSHDLPETLIVRVLELVGGTLTR